MEQFKHKIEQLTYRDVFSLELPDILKVTSDFEIPLDGCQNVDQFRERIWLHRKTVLQKHFDIREEFTVQGNECHGNMRQTLDSLLKGVHKAIEQLSHFPAIERVLHSECSGSDTNESLAQQIEARRRSLKDAEFTVIIAGETNAGKSTLLNLILGMDILPCCVLCCTATVCVLRYSPDFRAEVEFKDGRSEVMTFTSVEDARESLIKVVQETDEEKREKGLAIKTINVYLPALILQSGVTLVDTPGVGENDAMDKCTMDYVRQNSAAAYVYVIKTDNAGGMQDDRLLEFLRAILRHNESDESAEVFDPTSALFVCNRWDQIPEEQRDRVRQNAYAKLRDVWPGFEPSQAHFLSTTDSLMHWKVDPTYVTEDFESVLKGMKNVFDKARHNAVNQHYRWLKHLLHQSTMLLQTTIAQCTHTDEELEDRFRSTVQKLEALQARTTQTTDLLRLKLEEETLRLCDTIADILEGDEVREELENWDLKSVPDVPVPGSSGKRALTFLAIVEQFLQAQTWGEEVDTAIIKRLVELVDQAVQQRGLAQNLLMSFRALAKQELKLVDEEMDSITGELKDTKPQPSNRSSISSGSSTYSLSEDELSDSTASELFKLYKERNVVRLGNLKNISRVTMARQSSCDESEATMNGLPKVTRQSLASKLLAPLTAMKNAVKHKRKTSMFETNPKVYLRERGLRLAGAMAKNRPCLQQMAYKYRQRLDFLIIDIDSSIPRFIAINKQLMEDIRTNRRQFLSQRREMAAVMEKLEPLRELLRGFGSLYIRDVTADNICFMLEGERRRSSVMVSVRDIPSQLIDSGYNGSRRSLSSSSLTGTNERANSTSSLRQSRSPSPATSGSMALGLWHVYRWGHVTYGHEQEDILGRTYIQGLPEQDLIREIARLRCLRSDEIAPFLGMTRMDNTAVFLFRGDLMPARRFLRSSFHAARESVPHFLEGVLKGLDYLHREGLVHMELSLDTAMVDREGNAKLCGACLPSHPRFPCDANTVEARPFICLSPEVLRGELYTADDDIYSFGLVAWESCLKEEPYSEQKSWTLEQFRNQIHPSYMLRIENIAPQQHQEQEDEPNGGKIGEPLGSILRGCLLPARGLRLKMDKLRALAGELRSDPTILSLSNLTRRHVRRPGKFSRNSSAESRSS